MTRTHSQSVHHFAGLEELSAEMSATPEFQAVFGEPVGLTITGPSEDPSELDLPEPLAAA